MYQNLTCILIGWEHLGAGCKWTEVSWNVWKTKERGEVSSNILSSEQPIIIQLELYFVMEELESQTVTKTELIQWSMTDFDNWLIWEKYQNIEVMSETGSVYLIHLCKLL